MLLKTVIDEIRRDGRNFENGGLRGDLDPREEGVSIISTICF